MTGYTLIVSKEEQKRIDICDAFTCFGKHLRVTQQDAVGRVQAYRPSVCLTCSTNARCEVLRQLADEWMNNGL